MNSLKSAWLLAFGFALFLMACNRGESNTGLTLQERFIQAIAQSNTEATDSCLQKGVNPNLKDEEGTPALILAVNTGNAALVRLLLSAKADVNTPRDDFYKSSALMETAPRNDTLIAKMLLEAGASVQQRDSFGDTALHWAAYYGHIALSRILLDAGAKWDIKSRHGTPVDQAMRQWHDELVEYFKQRGAGKRIEDTRQKAWIEAVIDGDLEQVRYGLKNGIKANMRDELGSPALVLAASAGNAAMVEILLDDGAEIDAENQAGQTALSRASFFGHEASVDLLLERGADVNAAGPAYLLTPLISAASGGQTLIGEKLMKHGASIDQQEAVNGFTPLMLATAYGYTSFVKLLIEYNANPHIKSFDGTGLPDMLGYSGNMEIAKMLETYLLAE